ncbi:hypothetical protein [Helicobacter pylori]|uniref:hypothetical protein n=1 Tax=Helicobacter pylori TaxID=210 RepID=UPI001F098747|nr:hypothetical protein [Helicobacter pylori]
MKSTRCLVECLNLSCIDDSRFYNEIPLSVSLIKGFLLYYKGYIIMDEAVLEGFVFLRIDLALCD